MKRRRQRKLEILIGRRKLKKKDGIKIKKLTVKLVLFVTSKPTNAIFDLTFESALFRRMF